MTPGPPSPARTRLRTEVLWLVGVVFWIVTAVGGCAWFLTRLFDV